MGDSNHPFSQCLKIIATFSLLGTFTTSMLGHPWRVLTGASVGHTARAPCARQVALPQTLRLLRLDRGTRPHGPLAQQRRPIVRSGP